ncbi:MAG: acyltransferase [Actinomycetales bacterium]|nr:acyltransferase [Actinomycetales bacterium]
MQPKLKSLESLRGLAAVGVVFFHFRMHSSFDNRFVQDLWLMVDFFFVLSGFVMTLAYADRLANRRQFFEFAKKRFLRLYPLHILVLLAWVTLEFSTLLAVNHLGYAAESDPFSGRRSLGALVANLLLVHNLVLPNNSWNYPSWSISAEFFVYLLFAMVYVFFSSRARIRLGVFALLMFLACLVLWLEGMRGQTNISGPSRCVFSFILGHFTYLLLQKDPRRNLRFLGFLTVCLSIFFVTMKSHFPDAIAGFIPVIFAITIYCVVRSPGDSAFIRALEIKPLVFLGTISYGIYMWHALVLDLITRFVRTGLSYPLVEGPNGRLVVEYQSVAVANVAIVLLMASSIGLAWLSYRFFETRFYRSGPRDTGASPVQR